MIKDRFNYKNNIINCFIENNNSKTILLIAYSEEEKELYELVKNECNIPFNLIIISNINWNDNLSPFEFDGIYKSDIGYKGNANIFINYIENDLYPYIKNKYNLNSISLSIMGYSLAGLFSLYTGIKTNIFDSIISVSGSMWFPGLTDFIKTNNLSNSVKYIYLSLGDKEYLSRNKYMSLVQDKTLEIYEYYKKENIDIVFELNEGGHFVDSLKRQKIAIIKYLTK